MYPPERVGGPGGVAAGWPAVGGSESGCATPTTAAATPAVTSGSPGGWGARPGYGGPPGGPPRPGSAWSEQRGYGPGPQYSIAQGGPYPGSPGRPGPGVRPSFRPDPTRGPPPRPMAPGRREAYNFPVDSLEQTQPLLMRRKKLTKVDVQPVEGWRIVLALKSGLLMESSWALDTLNVLLFDDNSVSYFGLGNMPGLLDALIDTWRAALIQVFDVARDLEMSTPKTEQQRKRKREKLEKSLQGVKWYEKKPVVIEDEAGLGIPDSDTLRRGEKVRILHHQPKDFTVEARFSEKEYQVDEQDEKLFVIDDERSWDNLGDHTHSGEDLFDYGVGQQTGHIVPADRERPHLPFVRIIKDLRSSLSDSPKKASSKENANSESLKVSPSKKHKRRLLEEWKVTPAKSETEK